MVPGMESKKEVKKNRFLWGRLALFLLFQAVLFSITFPLLVFYGPFDNVKAMVVGMSINSSKFQFVARTFLPEEEIGEILKSSYAVDPTARGEKVRRLEFGENHSDRIEVFDIQGKDFKGKMMVIYDPTSIEVGYSEKMPVSGETTSSIARRNNAVAAINGGGFTDNGWVGTGGSPMGYIIHKGEVIYNQSGSEKVRMDTAAFTEDGMLIVGMHSIEELKKYNVKEGISFGPPLVVNGKPTITTGDGGWGIAPRTAIGQRKNGEVLFLVVDGRSIESVGATLKDVQDILIKYGAVNAVNLDGGSSTTMFFNGEVINKPADRLGERKIPTAFIVVPKSRGDFE